MLIINGLQGTIAQHGPSSTGSEGWMRLPGLLNRRKKAAGKAAGKAAE